MVKPTRDIPKEPEQEPVAWMYKGEPSFDGNKWNDTSVVTTSKQVAFWKDKDAKPLYTTPPQRKPLTDEQIATISVECATVSPSDIYFARAIEAAHNINEKNTK